MPEQEGLPAEGYNSRASAGPAGFMNIAYPCTGRPTNSKPALNLTDCTQLGLIFVHFGDTGQIIFYINYLWPAALFADELNSLKVLSFCVGDGGTRTAASTGLPRPPRLGSWGPAPHASHKSSGLVRDAG